MLCAYADKMWNDPFLYIREDILTIILAQVSSNFTFIHETCRRK